MSDLPFTYMLPDTTREACGFGSINSMQRATREGRFIKPDYINGRARYRSDRVGEWLKAQAERNDAEREQRQEAARKKGRAMYDARGSQTATA